MINKYLFGDHTDDQTIYTAIQQDKLSIVSSRK